MPSCKEAILAFDARHGDWVRDRNYVRYADGAVREAVSAYPALQEPPSDPQARARRILQYHECRLRHAIDDFDRCKQRLHDFAKASLRERNPGLGDAELAELQAFKGKVKATQADVDQARTALQEVTPPQVPAMERVLAENVRRNQSFLNALRGVEV